MDKHDVSRLHQQSLLASGMGALAANAREVLDIIVHHEDVVAVRNRLAREGQILRAQLYRGAWISLMLVTIGLLVGKAGASLATRAPGAAWLAGGVGLILRFAGTIWAMFWLGAVLLKASLVVHALQLTSEYLNGIRRRVLNAVGDSPVAGALAGEIALIPESTAARIKNGFLSVYLWITLLGIFTLVPGFLGVEISLQMYGLVAILTFVILLVSLARGGDFVRLAWLIHVVLLVVAVGYLAVRSPAGAYVVGLYHDSDYYKAKLEKERRLARGEAKWRVLRGTEQPGDKALLGVAYEDFELIREIQSKTHPDDCDKSAVAKLEARADAKLAGRVNMVDVPDCDALRAQTAKVTAQQQRRRRAYNRVLAGGASEGRHDKRILGPLYAEAIEIRVLGSKPKLDPCHSMRLDRLKMRLDAFIGGNEYGEILPTVCDDPAAVPLDAGAWPPPEAPDSGVPAAGWML